MDYPKFTLPILFFSLYIAAVRLPFPRAIPRVAASHDTGVHKNYLIILRRPYEYDQNLYKNTSSWHASLLSSVCDSAKEALESDSSSVARLIYSYRNVVNGFAARISDEELVKMSKMDWFVEAIPEKTYQLLTTRTPQLLGLMNEAEDRDGVWNKSNMGEGIIIGVLDDGINAGHPSFDGKGMPPPPAKWNGRCDFNSSVCNNKLIGARSYFESAKWKWKGLHDPVLPINEGPHGTHTSSTAAGSFVPGANILGNGLGTAAGMAPRAHIAFYQVCFEGKGCDRDDILAAVDDAIEDGVDVLSLSIGDGRSTDFSDDSVALAGYTAVLNGVFISTAAGNSGPGPGTLCNDAPWLLTVAASTTDRRFVATVKLGNGDEIDGESLNQTSNFKSPLRPLVRDVGEGTCSSENILLAQNVSGKIILCDFGGGLTSTEKAKIVLRAGAAGMIYVGPKVFASVVVPKAHVLPTTQVSYAAGQKIRDYVQSTPKPTATFMFKGTVLNTPQSPMIAPFSSRGPNMKSKGILKPDITGPGVNILAGVPMAEWMELPSNAEVPKFDIKSGTSMAAPHLSGIAALIKKAHPTWPPAAIKSAMMTTTNTTDNGGKPITDIDGSPASFFALGAGYVNPEKAMDPGLVYNMTAEDYIPYLCGLNYTDLKVNSIIYPVPAVTCANMTKLDEKDLNYPSITAILDKAPLAVTVNRTVTNVGIAMSVYEAEVDMPEKTVSVQVTPPKLMFKELNEVMNFTVTIKSTTSQLPGAMVEGQLKWVSGKYVVRSPILVLSGMS